MVCPGFGQGRSLLVKVLNSERSEQMALHTGKRCLTTFLKNHFCPQINQTEKPINLTLMVQQQSSMNHCAARHFEQRRAFLCFLGKCVSSNQSCLLLQKCLAFSTDVSCSWFCSCRIPNPDIARVGQDWVPRELFIQKTRFPRTPDAINITSFQIFFQKHEQTKSCSNRQGEFIS